MSNLVHAQCPLCGLSGFGSGVTTGPIITSAPALGAWPASIC